MGPIQNVHKLGQQVYGEVWGFFSFKKKNTFCSNESTVNQGQVLSRFRKASYHKIDEKQKGEPSGYF